jgi:hypothetical protein
MWNAETAEHAEKTSLCELCVQREYENVDDHPIRVSAREDRQPA